MKIAEKEIDPQKKLDEWGIPVSDFDWRAYNKSQTREKTLFLKLLDELCTLPPKTTYCKNDLPKKTAHMIFCMCLKVYCNVSSRRLISELEMCERVGYLRKVPHFNSVLNYFRGHNITKHLKYLVRLSALPLGQLETKFAPDSSGIAEHKYLPRWSKVRQEYRRHRQYKKVHCIYGVHSNIIASVFVTDGNKADSPYFKQLLKEASENFDISEVLADMGYLSRDNMQFADDLGISPYIPFKKNVTGRSKGCMIWRKMYKHFKENPKDFAKHYHLRSNAESGFFMIKQKLGEFVYTKDPTAQINEILCKCLCHNLMVLIQEIFLSKIEIDFLDCAKRYIAQDRI